MRTYTLNIYPQFADPIFEGSRTFDVRENSAGFQTGDLIRYTCISGEGTTLEHPINNALYQISYIMSGWGICKNNVVFALQRVNLPQVQETPSTEAAQDSKDTVEIDDAS